MCFVVMNNNLRKFAQPNVYGYQWRSHGGEGVRAWGHDHPLNKKTKNQEAKLQFGPSLFPPFEEHTTFPSESAINQRLEYIFY